MSGLSSFKQYLLVVKHLMWNKQFATFLIFLFLAAAFWAMTSLDEVTEHNFTIRLVLKNVPENVIITNNVPTQVEVKLRDKAAILLAYQYQEELPPIEIDFAKHMNMRNSFAVATLELLRPMVQKLRGNTAIVNVNKESILIDYAHVGCKRVPVAFKGKINKGSEYIVSDFFPEPDSVLVYAPKSVLDTITAAYIGGVYERQEEDTVLLEGSFLTIPQVKFVPATITYYLCFDRLVEKKLTVPIRSINFPAQKSLRTFPGKVEVKCRVGMNSYRHVTSEQFAIMVSYEEILATKNNRIHLRLRSLPKGVKSAEIFPKEVDFITEDLPETE